MEFIYDKKSHIKKLLFLSIVIVSVVVACKKSNSTPGVKSCTLSKESLVGNWYIVGATYKKTSSSQPEDIFNDDSWFEPCERDDYFQLNADATYIFKDAGVTCAGGATINGNWVLSNDTIYANPTSGGAQGINPVTSFSCDTMIITTTNIDTVTDRVDQLLVKKP